MVLRIASDFSRYHSSLASPLAVLRPRIEFGRADNIPGRCVGRRGRGWAEGPWVGLRHSRFFETPPMFSTHSQRFLIIPKNRVGGTAVDVSRQVRDIGLWKPNVLRAPTRFEAVSPDKSSATPRDISPRNSAYPSGAVDLQFPTADTACRCDPAPPSPCAPPY